MGEGSTGLSPVDPPSSDFGATSVEREFAQRMRVVILVLLALLAASALWQPEATRQFQYRGIPRWNGAWDNPNLYGLLMAVGVVLAVGLLIQNSTSNIR